MAPGKESITKQSIPANQSDYGYSRRISEQQYRQLLESLSFGIVLQEDQQIVFANTAIANMLGLRDTASLKGYSFYDFIHPDYRVDLKIQINQLINQQGSRELLEKKLVRLDGSELDVDIDAQLQQTDEGTLLTISIKDISKRKNIERALKQSEEEFRQLAESMPQFVWTARPDGWIDYMNTRWFEYTGQSIDDTQGWGWEQVMHPDDLSPCIARWTEKLQTGQTYEMEYRYKRKKDATYRWHLGRAFSIRDDKGQIIKWIGTSTDIHDQKMAEEEVRKLNQQLELRVKERTAQLELANQELESFCYSVSHDLRAPLRHIVSFVGLLEKHIQTFIDEKAQRYIQTITESAINLQQLIDNLLEFSRMGRADLQQQEVDLNRLITQIIQNMTDEIGDKPIVWDIQSLPKVYADPVMLSQVLINLLSNAIKFTRTQPVAKIAIAASLQTDYAIISIKDNGVGFDMKFVDKLFGVFQRLHSKREFEGTGIGLANVQRIIQRHGGKVWAEGDLLQGATFYFTLSIAKRKSE